MVDEERGTLPPSKSQLKREAAELQRLGEALVALSPARRAGVPMPDSLREAVELAARIRQRGGRRRQLQYIGKLMRTIDTAPIRAALEAFERQGAEESARFHRLERWRDRLLEEGDAALEELLRLSPGADRQRLRALIRQARAERLRGGAPKAARALFRLLRELPDLG